MGDFAFHPQLNDGLGAHGAGFLLLGFQLLHERRKVVIVHVIVDHQAVVLAPVNGAVLDDADQSGFDLGSRIARSAAGHGHVQLAFLNQRGRHDEVNQQKEAHVDQGRDIQLGIFILNRFQFLVSGHDA